MTGIIVGLIMGLTGAGGALIALPLFTRFHGMDLKLATTYSLLAVIFAAGLNFFSQRKSADVRLALTLSGFSLLGSLLAAPAKASLALAVVKALLLLVAVFAVWSIWRPPQALESAGTRRGLWVSAVSGVTLGVLTTFTGLGGGVLMVPLFLRVYGLTQAQAVATSLLAVALASTISLLIQLSLGASMQADLALATLVVGLLIAVTSLQWSLKKLAPSHLLRVRQIVFTAVVMFALVTLL